MKGAGKGKGRGMQRKGGENHHTHPYANPWLRHWKGRMHWRGWR